MQEGLAPPVPQTAALSTGRIGGRQLSAASSLLDQVLLRRSPHHQLMQCDSFLLLVPRQRNMVLVPGIADSAKFIEPLRIVHLTLHYISVFAAAIGVF